MKYLRKFENYLIENGPKIGDYIVVSTTFDSSGLPNNVIDLLFFINNNVGQLIDIREINDTNPYVVTYNFSDNITSQFDYKLMEFYLTNKDIIFWSSSKENAELYLSAKKYNL